jgi:hypothetical protein
MPGYGYHLLNSVNLWSVPSNLQQSGPGQKLQDHTISTITSTTISLYELQNKQSLVQNPFYRKTILRKNTNHEKEIILCRFIRINRNQRCSCRHVKKTQPGYYTTDD